MAITPVWITGFEYGLETPSINGLGIADAVVGAPTIQSTYKCSGDYALRCNAAGAATNIQKKTGGSSANLVASFNILFHAWPDAKAVMVTLGNAFGSPYGLIYLDPADHKLEFDVNTNVQKYATALSLDTPYRIDLNYAVGSTTHTINAQVDGNAITQVSSTGMTATTVYSIRLGPTAAVTVDVIFDDVIMSITSADYPIGAHEIAGLRPGSDGTHANAANIMEDINGNDIDGVNYFAYDKLNDNPWGTAAATGYVRQTANGTANYCEINFSDTAETVILGAIALLQYASAATTANNGGCIVIDEDGGTTPIWGAIGALADYSETSPFYKSAILPAPAGGWDAAAVNALKCRFGYSSDANPDPYWLAIMLEVAYTPAAGTAATVNAVAGTAVAAMLAPTLSAYALINGTVAAAAAAMIAPNIGISAGVTAVVATSAAAAIPPVITSGANVTGVVATASAAGKAPALSSQVNIMGVVANAPASMPAPTIAAGVSIAGTVATATAAMIAPSLSSSVSVTAAVATASAAMLPPDVSTAGNARVDAVVATAGAAMIAPALSAGISIVAVVATATAEAIAPAVAGEGGGDAAVSVVVATAAGAMLAPSISSQAAITGTVASATALAIAPTLSGACSVSCGLAEASAQAIAPSLSSGVSVTGIVATATAAMIAPSVTGAGSGDAEVVAVVMTALAAMIAPNVGVLAWRRWHVRPAVIEYRGSQNMIDGARRYKRQR